ncbi:MAG: septum formation initiator family protein [Cyclobacteriaceae bacterium]|nr:septum formation initiator family protein [Cyclobacteriaceae bacterium SS2]
MINKVFNRIPPFFRSFYFLAIFFFLVWMLFFDSNDIITQSRLSGKLSELKQARSFYEEKIIEVKNDREALLNDKNLLEKIAREKYFMKKSGEEIFVLVEE